MKSLNGKPTQLNYAAMLVALFVRDERPHLTEFHPYLKVDYVLADAGYDLVPIYQQVKELGAHSLITFCRFLSNLSE